MKLILTYLLLLLGTFGSLSQPIDSVFVSVEKGYLYLEIPGWPHLMYTQEAADAQVEGDVILQFDLTKDCQVTNRKVAQSPGYGLDEVAIEVFDWIQDEFVEQEITECPATPEFKVPVTFTLKRWY